MNRPPPDLGDPKPADPVDPPPELEPSGPVHPAWLDGARTYYSRVGTESALPVSVFEVSEGDEVSEEHPGRLCLRLEPRSFWSPRAAVLDGGGKLLGSIRPAGLIPGVSYTMRRDDGDLVWTISVRNLVRTRHSLVMANGDGWTIVTPFFARLHIVGGCNGVPALLGRLHSNWWGIWLWKIEPGRDTGDLLAALAFLHRQYGRS